MNAQNFAKYQISNFLQHCSLFLKVQNLMGQQNYF